MRPAVFTPLLFQLFFLAITAEDKKPPLIEDVTDAVLDERAKKTEFVLALIYSDKAEKMEIMKNAVNALTKVAKDTDITDLQIVKVKNSKRVAAHGFRTLPKILFFRKDLPVLYDGEKMAAAELGPWVDMNREVTIRTLTDDTFEHLTQASSGATTGDWFVMFYQKKCNGLLPAFEAAANRMKQKVVFARVDVATNPKLEKRFKIDKCPTLKFFRLGNMYTFDIASKETKSLISFAEGFYKNAKTEKVLGESSPFDEVVENIALNIKEKVEILQEQVETPQGKIYIVAAAGGVLVILILIFCCCCRGDGRRRPKFD